MTDDSLGQPKPTSCAVVTQTFTQARFSAPFIIDGAVRQWPARDWTVDKLADALGEKTFGCRLMPLEREVKGVPAWEAEGVYVKCQLHQFNSWCHGEASQDNPLAAFSPLHFSAYIDYKYMTQVFAETPRMLGEVQWNTLGLDGQDGQNSTIWIGSSGASTPCHYDTYGFNLVAQIQGRKRWVLVPPVDSECMYPTRIPYEESSVFSQVDVTCPDLRKFPAFKKVQPIVITLEPGQVLYVPRHWWHYVTCTQTAISINTWVDVPEDNVSRLQEAVTRVLASSLIPYLAQTAGPSLEDIWINPTEELEGTAVSVEYLKAALSSWQPVTCKPKSRQDSSGSGDKHPRLSAQVEITAAATAMEEEQDKHADSNSSSSRKERPQEDCKKYSYSNTTPHQEDTTERHPLPEQCSYSGNNSSPQPVTTDTRVTSDHTESKRLGQLARALQCCPLQCVQSPFCLSERHNKTVGHTTSGTLRLSCGSVKHQTNISENSLSRKRKHSGCEDSVAAESNTSTEAFLQRPTNYIQLEKPEELQGTHINKVVGSHGDSETQDAQFEQSITDLHSADLNLSVYVPKPCSLEAYLQMLEYKDGTEDEYSEKDVEEKDMFLERETEKKTSRGLAKEEEMSHADQEREGRAPYSNEKENVQDRSQGEDDGCLEEKLLRSVLHPEIVKLIVQKMVDRI